MLLKPHGEEEHKKNFKERFFIAFNTGFDNVTNKYVKSLKFLVRRKWVTEIILVVASVFAYFLFQSTPSGFIPAEDRGIIMMDVSMPPGTTLKKTQQTLDKLDKMFAGMGIVKERLLVNGTSLINGINGASYCFGVIKLQDFKERKDASQSVDTIVGQLFGMTAQFKDARILFFTPPSVSGYGSADGFESNLQSKGEDSWQQMNGVTGGFLQALNSRPEIQYAITSFNPNFPQYPMDINIERTKDAGVSISDIFNMMQGYYGGLYTTDFNRFGKQFRVMLQA